MVESARNFIGPRQRALRGADRIQRVRRCDTVSCRCRAIGLGSIFDESSRMIDLGPEVLAAAKAIGLVDGSGALSPGWFESPLAGIEKLLSSADQRKAFLDLVDRLFPPEATVGAPSIEKWHPLLGRQPSGNLYLTVANGANPLKLGVAGEVRSTASPLPTSLRCHLPIVMAGSSGISAIAGTVDGPFKLDLRTELNWSKAKGQSIELRAIRASAQL